MQTFSKKTAIIVIVVFVVFLASLFWVIIRKTSKPKVVIEEVEEVVEDTYQVIGKSVQGRDIEAYTYGKGETRVLFVGGVHGGYEWNSILVAYNLMEYLEANPEVIPESISVIVVPNLNPDGSYKIVGKEGIFLQSDVPSGNVSAGRFNANGVDLNRNFDCKWQPKSTWQSKTVSAGSKPFSEPESGALRDLILNKKPKAVIFWHSQGGAVYASQCENGILTETIDIMNAYAKASGYPADETYDAYQTTGDADAWLARIGIPSITVELRTHENVEWEQNLRGIKSVLQYFGGK